MMIIHMPGYAKNTGDLESPHGKGVPEISNIQENNRKLPTCEDKLMNSAASLTLRTFRQLGQAGISICKPTAPRYKASSQGRERRAKGTIQF